MYEEKEMFGKCPICDAIVSLDRDNNVLCDRCRSKMRCRRVTMPTKEDLDNGFNPFCLGDE